MYVSKSQWSAPVFRQGILPFHLPWNMAYIGTGAIPFRKKILK